MKRQILVQIAFSLISLLLVSALIFWLVELLPGDAAERVLGQAATEESLELLREQLGLDQPAHVRYLNWLSDAVRGEFGYSLIADQPVTGYIASRLANTISLAVYALILFIPISVLLGMITAIYRGGAVDLAISTFVIVGMCIPEFVIAILLVSIFSIGLGWFPPLVLMDTVTSFAEMVHILFLPAITLTAAMTAYSVRLMRESLIDILESDYVQLAHLKGLPSWRVLLWHALPNALGPAINVLALNIAWLIGSIVIVETVFNFDGLGRLLVDSIRYKDSTVIQAIVLILCAVYILANLIADIAILALNPKLGREG